MTDGQEAITELSRGNSEEDVVYSTENWFHTVAGVLGNVLEWYDFAIFGFFSGKLLCAVYFFVELIWWGIMGVLYGVACGMWHVA
jgi:hypothetical protein